MTPAMPGPAAPTPATRSLGLATATALVVADTVGTGVFTTSGFLPARLKSPSLILGVCLTGGVLAALGALRLLADSERVEVAVVTADV